MIGQIINRFNGVRIYVLNALKSRKFRKNASIFSHLTFDEKSLLEGTAKSLPSQSVCVEIGSYLGASACFIASGLNADSKIVCIDTWGNQNMKYVADDTDADERDTYAEFVVNTKDYRSKIIEIRKWSTEAIEDVKKISDKIDFLFIDGDHNYDGVKKDWDLYSHLLKKNSIIAFHDTGWAEGVQKVIDEDVKKVAVLMKKLPNLELYRLLN